METILDLTTGGADREALTDTAVSGRLRTKQLLSGAPLAERLDGDEEPKYLLRNKKSGVTVAAEEESRTMEPDDQFQALALVTDVRVLFAIGTADGDRTVSVSHSEMVQAKRSDEGFRTTALVIETIDGRRWTFPCKGDTAEVASVVDGLAQVWANAERLADEAEEAIETAEQHLAADEYEAAAEALADVKANLRTAIARLREVGASAGAHIETRGERLARRLLDLQGPLWAQLAASAHGEAMAAWREGEFERAATEYEEAIRGYEQALDRDSGPSTGVLEQRLDGALTERELLRVMPLVEADTARRHAREIEEPEAAAANWETVLEGYQGLLALDWPGDRGFVADSDIVHTQAAAAAEDAIEDYFEAGKRRLGSADRFAVDGREDRASVLYERARDQFEAAHRLATEAHPDRVEELETALSTVDRRINGDVPAEALPHDELTVTDGDEEPAEADDEPDATGDGDEPGSTVIGRIQSQKQEERAAAPGGVNVNAGDGAGNGVTNTELRGKLRDLEEGEFTQLVADLWEAQGWSTTVFSATKQVVYDIVAMREEPEQQRLLLWTEHKPGEEQLGPRSVERCATARDSSQGAESATLVTNALPRTAARQRAEGLDVTVIDGQDLVELLRFEGFLDRLEADRPNA
jgi:tetratricopeptide (TPR) repeat protein